MTNDLKQQRILQEASNWHTRIYADDFSSDELLAYEQWLTQGSEHAQVIVELDELSQQLNQTNILATEPSKLATNFSKTLEQARCVALGIQSEKQPNRQKALRYFGGVAASLMLVFAVIYTQFSETVKPVIIVQQAVESKIEQLTYETSIGESRYVLLSDGTMIQLNTDSKVIFSVQKDKRNVILHKGEVFFEVAKNKHKPFVVAVGLGEVRAVGTAFNIRHRSDQVEVTVTEGTVEISPDKSKHPDDNVDDNLFTAGSRVVFAHDIISQQHLSASDLRGYVSWQLGKLVFDNVTVREMVKEIQSYTSKQIIVKDLQLLELRGSGVFRVENIDSVFRAMEYLFPLKVVEKNGVITLTKI